jgi:hypothetical protein
VPPHLATFIELLHTIPRAALATHSTSLPGYPFASAVAFAPSEGHRPVLLMSRLADAARIQVIGGFARAGWIEGSALRESPHLTQDQETSLRERLAPGLPEHWILLGVDAYGADFVRQGRRERITFQPSPVLPEAVPKAFARALQRRLASPAAAADRVPRGA